MSFPKAKVFPATARVNAQGHLTIGGCDVVSLAAQFGTPLYVFDEATLRGQARAFVQEFTRRHPDTRVVYACKAFINVPLARLLHGEGLGFDVVSGGEAAVLRAAGVPPQGVYFHGNNKGRQELEEALAWGIGRVVVDNLQELELLEELCARTGRRQEVLLRVNPGVDPHTHHYTTTGVLDSKFGLPLQTGQAEQAVRRALASRHLRLMGLHFHLGSPIFELEPYATATDLAVEFAARFREEGFRLEELSPGGGFAIAYLEEQNPPSPAEYAETIVAALRSACHRLGMALPRLVVEPGRAIVGPAAVAVYTVGVVKDIPGVRRYVAVDGGMGDNIRPALYEARYEAVAANRMGDAPTARATIAGKYCESGDILVRDAPLPEVRPGDLIATPAAGAYAPAMASAYNLNPRPALVLVHDGQARLIRRRESYEDLVRLDVVE